MKSLLKLLWAFLLGKNKEYEVELNLELTRLDFIVPVIGLLGVIIYFFYYSS